MPAKNNGRKEAWQEDEVGIRMNATFREGTFGAVVKSRNNKQPVAKSRGLCRKRPKISQKSSPMAMADVGSVKNGRGRKLFLRLPDFGIKP